MRCIKTGFIARLPNDLFAHGDAFATNTYDGRPDLTTRHNQWPHETLILRISAVTPLRPKRIHLSLLTWDLWFDEFRFDQSQGYKIYQPNSTLIASPGQWLWLSYEGTEL